MMDFIRRMFGAFARTSTSTAPSRPARIGGAIPLALLIMACVSAAAPEHGALVACRSASSARGGTTGAVTPSGEWDERASLVLDVLGGTGSIPGAVAVTETVVSIWPIADTEAKASVLEALRHVRTDLLPELRAGLDAYRRGDAGGRCTVSAALRGSGVALRGVAVTLARVMRWDVVDALSFGISLAVAVADELNPSCVPDAGWSSLGRETQQALAARGSRLRRFPTEAEARTEARGQ